MKHLVRDAGGSVPRQVGDDSGSVMILMIFFAAIVAGLLTVVVDVSTVFLGQRELQAVADGAAAAAAQRVDVDALYGTSGSLEPGTALQVSTTDAAAAIDAYLALPAHRPGQCADGTLHLRSLQVVGATVGLELSCRVGWPFVSVVVGDEIAGHSISMSAQARLVVRPLPSPS